MKILLVIRVQFVYGSSIEIENIVYNCDSKYSTDSHDFNIFLICNIILSISYILC